MNKDEFIKIYTENIKREGADKLLAYLSSPSCDFFTAPASTRFHSAYAGGLLDHSLNVYHCLKDYLQRPRVKETYGLNPSDETVAIVSLLHDLCKINCYKPSTRNVKDAHGVWHTVPTFSFEDDMPLSGSEESYLVGNAFEKFPLAFALSTADMEATYFMEEPPEKI